MARSKSRLSLQLLESAHLWWAGAPTTERVEGRLRIRQPMTDGADAARIETMLRESCDAAMLAILALLETAPDEVALWTLSRGPASFITWEYPDELVDRAEQLYVSNPRFRVMMRLVDNLPDDLAPHLRGRFEAMCPSACEYSYRDDWYDDEDDWPPSDRGPYPPCGDPLCPCRDC